MTGKLKSQKNHSESRSKTPQTVLKAVLKKEEQM